MTELPKPVGILGRVLVGAVVLAVLLLIALLVLSQRDTRSSSTTRTTGDRPLIGKDAARALPIAAPAWRILGAPAPSGAAGSPGKA